MFGISNLRDLIKNAKNNFKKMKDEIIDAINVDVEAEDDNNIEVELKDKEDRRASNIEPYVPANLNVKKHISDDEKYTMILMENFGLCNIRIPKKCIKNNISNISKASLIKNIIMLSIDKNKYSLVHISKASGVSLSTIDTIKKFYKIRHCDLGDDWFKETSKVKKKYNTTPESIISKVIKLSKDKRKYTILEISNKLDINIHSIKQIRKKYKVRNCDFPEDYFKRYDISNDAINKVIELSKDKRRYDLNYIASVTGLDSNQINYIRRENKVRYIDFPKDYFDELFTPNNESHSVSSAGEYISDDDIIKIKDMFKDGIHIDYIAKTMHLSKSNLYKYKREVSTKSRKIRRKISEDDKLKIESMLKQRVTVSYIAETMNISKSNIYKYKRELGV